MLKSKTEIITLFESSRPLTLDSGHKLPAVQAAFETYGRLNAAGDNAILVCHALTGDAHAAGITQLDAQTLHKIPLYRSKKTDQPGWWDGLIGPGKALDTNRYFVVCSNILGSCYGTTGPMSVNPQSGRPYGPDFPEITVRDMVKVQKALLDALSVKSLVTVIGGSLGGMQVLEWALLFPQMVRSIVPIATAAGHSAWAIGFNHLARQAVMNDPHWQGGHYRRQPERGLALARQIGMISYRTDISFQHRFGRDKRNDGKEPVFQVESYLAYQGEKLVKRFDANSFVLLTRALDSHDVGRDRGGIEQALHSICCPALCVGIDSDILYPAREQQEIARQIPQALYREIKSPDGHDAFLIEYEQLNAMVREFLASK
ncbi:homoserine O-acetyltransferase MetX [Caldithrix abyssi]